MPLGKEVGLGPGGIVLDGDPSSPPHTFRPTLLWHGRQSQQLLSSCLIWWVSFNGFRNYGGGYRGVHFLKICSAPSIETVRRN